MEEGIKQNENQNLEAETETGLRAASSILPSTEFVKVEKNLASLGFFTPSSKRTRDERSKTVAVTVVIEGKRIEAKATIAPTALFGLPITADQDKWLALHKIIADVQARDGQVQNPVSFSSAELLALLKIYKDSGKNYKDVSDWLDVMVGTTIISEGAVYFAGKRTFGKDTFHVFDRAVSFGKQLPDGSIADKNYVWLSQWQLQNINDHHQVPIDLDTYRQLRNYISKALVPLLQIWLYATRDEGVFEKRYDELCQILNIRQWSYFSKIKEKLGPSLEELTQFGYLADWRIENTSDKRGYKILLFHGEKFHRDRRARLNKKQPALRIGESHSMPEEHRHDFHYARPPQRQPKLEPTPSQQMFDPLLIAEFTRRGIAEKKAVALLAGLKPGQDVIAQLEHTDLIVKNAHVPITNPPGFYIRLIESNSSVPDNFETSAKRKAREERERRDRERRAAEDARQLLESDYDDYCSAETDQYLAEHTSEFEELKGAKWKETRDQHASLPDDMISAFAVSAAKRELQKQVPLLTFEEFVDRKKQGTDFPLKSVAVSPAAEVALMMPLSQDAEVSTAVVGVPGDALPPPTVGRESATGTAEPEMQPAIPEPMMIELASESLPPPQWHGDAAELG